jgi:membrane-associated phospholipid phosphatase
LKNKSGYNFLALLSPLDIGTIFYILFSGIYICFGISHLENVLVHFTIRIGIIALIFLLTYLQKKYPNESFLFLKNLYPLIFLSFFYTETSYMKNIIFSSNLDAYFSWADQFIFGFQPSLEFSKAMPQIWFNELMNACYFSYYPVTSVVCVCIYLNKKSLSYKPIFIMIFSFYMYYIIYAILPVVGPQYYFNTIFKEPTTLCFFGKIMRYILVNFEQPTGAFPSSHVGAALIASYLAYKHLKKLFYISLPFVLGICFATVYLKAHYAVDVLAAIVSVPVFIFVSGLVYEKLLTLSTIKQQNT